MTIVRVSLLAGLISFASISVVSAAPVVLGLTSKHPLTEAQSGELLLNELRCNACHQRQSATALPERFAPDLTDVGGRISPEYLQRFIAAPSAAHRGTTMPDVLESLPAEQRQQAARALAQFLIARSGHKFEPAAMKDDRSAAGKELFHTVGCVACHGPRDEHAVDIEADQVVDLAHLAAKYSAASLRDFLFQPARVRASGRMPDMKLTPDEAQSIAGYLLGKAASPAAAFEPQKELIEQGKTLFAQYQCAACHKLPDLPAVAAVTKGPLNADRGCLTNAVGKTPNYHLSDSQIKAIRAALAAKPAKPDDQTEVALMLTTFNCIACHVRDSYGGIAENRNAYFQTNQPMMGDDARIPPPLTLAGAKLKPAWMKKVLYDAESVRPYMFTRMPQFGEPNLRGLPERLDRMDVVEEVEMNIPSGENENKKSSPSEKELRTAGRELLGDKGLSCVACHQFNGKASPNHQGIDLMTSYQRLKPSWFYRFVINPNVYRPRIVMPQAWPGGKAMQKTILAGDTKTQISAIWYYLSLGTSAQDPSGIRAVETKLQVTDAARTYRGRSTVAGYRGIAVGLPGGTSYAFNAETGSLSAIWRGEFIRVDRSGQGSGAFNPASRAIALPQDVSLTELTDEKTPWPLRPTMTKAAPVNPDPLYPKNHGYQFKGYYLDESSVPTFMYRLGDIEIEDRSTPEKTDAGVKLHRTLQFSASSPHTIWFRGLTGKIEAASKQQFKTADLQLTLPKGESLLRAMANDPNQWELLLKLEIPQGKSTAEFIYEPLK